VKKPSILFISNTSRHARPYYDPSARYRCFNVAQSLSFENYPTACISQAVFQKNIDTFKAYDYYVFHRPALTPEFAEFSLSKSQERLIADFDDLNFSVQHADQTPAVRTRNENVSTVSKSLAKIAGAASLFNQFSSSTAPLTAHIAKLFNPDNNLVIPNGVDPTFAGICQLAREAFPVNKRPYTYAYFPGTASHNPDLQMIERALKAALNKDPSANILIAGPVKIPDSLEGFAHRIHKADYVTFHELPVLMAKSKFVLAPLENTEFNQCKSGLKFFEAALVGCSVIGTPIPDIDRFESSLLRKCSTEDEWIDALTRPITLTAGEIETEARKVNAEVSAQRQTKRFTEGFIH
jgi:hypothetical protein